MKTLYMSLWPGHYFEAIPYAGTLVKRGDHCVPLHDNNLADDYQFFELHPDHPVELLENEGDWPEIDYKPEIREWNWEGITKEIKKNIFLNDEGEPYGSCWIGSTFGVMPSGKIYAAWTSNQTPEDVNRDSQFNEALEKVCEEKGCFADWESGDLRVCKATTFEEVAKAAGFELNEYCVHHVWVEVKDRTNSGTPFEDEDEAWEDCCKENKLVQE